MDNLLVNLLEILLINIVLSGDNAVVIALACRNLEERHRNKAIFFGTFGAIFLRVVLTFVAVYLLKIPFLNFVGGLLLLWIAIKLLKGEEEGDVEANSSLSGAIKTIIVADLVMSLDNIVAVAGAANGNIVLIILGLIISIPLIIWGSQLLMKIMTRFPIIIILGAALLGYTAGEMMLKDKAVGHYLENFDFNLHLIVPLLLAVLVVVIGKFSGRHAESH
ncbi:integral membrane protein, YjbE family [Fictibacillus solisalsi]|uniref:Integral membrane protein, YjbE family n=1 Tax=Fictibacillus solisalsi TaxID=459525 RepID=A0A1G9YQF3_9BACL|nr:TerC family protein [Fictibacillus solisalsi]SDN10753.1 integral membrane protein, YjbE family [Fictibacillus solisalsi]